MRNSHKNHYLCTTIFIDMKKYIVIAIVSLVALSSCGEYNKVLKTTDYEYKYEAAKTYFAQGKNVKATTILEELISIMKGTANAQESAYMLAMSYFNMGDYEMASTYFTSYYTTYPRGNYTELARYYSARSLYLASPEARLDQTSTYKAIQELNMFMEYFPMSNRKELAQNMIFDLQDKLVEKEFYSANLYYDLGEYTGNTVYSSTGNNYLAAVVTAQNVLREYPYTRYREDLSILVLRAKFDLAKASVEEKKKDRMRETIDEYYAFKNEFPESPYMKEVEKIFEQAHEYVGDDEEEW